MLDNKFNSIQFNSSDSDDSKTDNGDTIEEKEAQVQQMDSERYLAVRIFV